MKYNKSLDHALMATFYANKAAKAKSVKAKMLFRNKALAAILKAGSQRDTQAGMRILEASLRLAAENEGLVPEDEELDVVVEGENEELECEDGLCEEELDANELCAEDEEDEDEEEIDAEEEEEEVDAEEAELPSDEEVDAAFRRIAARARARKLKASKSESRALRAARARARALRAARARRR